MTLDEQRRAIRIELESLKTKGAHRRELSLHACKRLFFDLGIRPSIAAVRDLTLTGSAGDIPKDIEHFWERIRETSKVRIGGSIPPALEEKAGELLGALFEHALDEARMTFQVERKEMADAVEDAGRQLREAEIRHEASQEALQRSENRADVAQTRVRELETEMATSATLHTSNHEALLAARARLETENGKLVALLESERTANAALRERLDALQADMRRNAEHYAAQIKDAIAQAERRVRPMLVELDSLRSMATTYQAGIRDANRKEFDFIQQLSAAKSRGDRLEADMRNQSEEIDALTKEVETLRGRGHVTPEIADVLCALARAGHIGESEFATLGTRLDSHVELPVTCPKCRDGEPELVKIENRYELQCPECQHSSGFGHSRLEAVTRFMLGRGSASNL